MGQRLQLHQLLEELCEHVYFQPKTNTKMEFPAILYKRDFAETLFADGIPWRREKRYMVTVIDRDPDSLIPDKVANLPMCSYNRFYTADDLNHDVFTLFF